MMNFIAAALPAVQTAAQTAEQTAAQESAQKYNYSIRFFIDWHNQLFKDAAHWCMQNGYYLVAGLVGVLLTVALCFALLLLLRKVIIPAVVKKQKNAASVLTAISAPAVKLVFWLGLSCSIDMIPFPTELHQTIDKVFYICFSLALLSIFQHALECTASLMIVRFKKKNPENYNMNKLLLDLSLSIIRLAVWLFIIIFILQEVFNFKVTHLIASAGILGLAIAFAAKDTIANIFGAFSILGGKMFQVGDGIKTGSTEGVVEQIGIRSIRIRAFNDGRLIDIPNHIIADSLIENYSTRLYWREHFSFGLVYSTTPEQITLAKKILSDIGRDFSDFLVEGKPVQFDLLLLDNSSINLVGNVWFKASDNFTKSRAQGLFNEEVLKRFQAAGIEIAFPTTTVYLENTEKK